MGLYGRPLLALAGFLVLSGVGCNDAYCPVPVPPHHHCHCPGKQAVNWVLYCCPLSALMLLDLSYP